LIHLDPGFLIGSLAPSTPEEAKLRAWTAAAQPLGLSAVAWTEFLCGPVDPAVVDLMTRIVHEPVAFTEEDAATAARLFNQAGRRRGSLIDCMIAPTALRSGAALATTNPRDFRPLDPLGLRVVTV
jgi:predicted nucleic acid-binding protein